MPSEPIDTPVRAAGAEMRSARSPCAKTRGVGGRGGKVILETERLVLREMTPGDFAALCRTLQDTEAMYAYEGVFSDTEVREWLDRQLARYRSDGFGLWAVELSGTGELIGQCGLTWQEFDGGRVMEVGYLFERAFWHHGYATEAARVCRDYAFDVLGAEEVFSIIRDTNAASLAVARRNGMKQRGSLVKHYRGVRMPHLVFSATRVARDGALPADGERRTRDCG